MRIILLFEGMRLTRYKIDWLTLEAEMKRYRMQTILNARRKMAFKNNSPEEEIKVEVYKLIKLKDSPAK